MPKLTLGELVKKYGKAVKPKHPSYVGMNRMQRKG